MIRLTGIDPDTHCLSFAYLDYDTERRKLVGLKVAVLKIAKGMTGKDAAQAMCQHPGLPEAVNRSGQYGALVVEGQDSVYTGKTNTGLTRDLIYLALVAGASMAMANQDTVYHPTPHQWKGSVPKHIHQCRTLNKAGIKYEMRGGKKPEAQYPVPLQFERFCLQGNVNAGDWQDVNDAVGLALWGLEKYLRERK